MSESKVAELLLKVKETGGEAVEGLSESFGKLGDRASSEYKEESTRTSFHWKE